MNSILTSIKKLIGFPEEDESFDLDIIMHINTYLSVLSQIGVGPSNGFSIRDKSATWADFLGEGMPNLDPVQTYIYIKVRLVFDPPASAAVIDSMTRAANELEWRLNTTADKSEGL